MKVKELLPLLTHEEDDIVVILGSPSIGPRAMTDVTDAHHGFDWERGKLILKTKETVTVKTKEESVYYEAHELMMYLATKPVKRESYEILSARRILKRCGYTDADFEKYRKFFHKENI
jgi:hypothetical protein